MQRSRSVEFIAIPVVLVLLGVIVALMLAAEAGVWAWTLVLIALVAVGLLAIGLAISRHRHPPAFDAPPPPRPSTSGSYRVLVVADESLPADSFRAEIAPHAAGRPIEALVVAPALRSRLAHWTGDDSDRDEAVARLAQTVGELEAAGITVRGEMGSDDPIEAADDGLRTFPADEVVFVTGRGPGNWLEEGVLDAARGRYRIQITHVETGPAPL